MIYLTFDDGPNPIVTSWVIEELEKYKAKATFFCVGQNASNYPFVIQKLLENGHRIGNHTYNHLKGWSVENDAYIANVKQAIPVTSEILFRPPYGRIKRKQAATLKSQGFRIIMWSLLSCDYLKNLNVQKSLNALIHNAKAGSIVVFHDSDKAFENMKRILPPFLKEMTTRGYIFDTL